MEAQAYHRDRAARHLSHYRIDCISMAPKSVQVKTRRSVRHAGKAALQLEVAEVLAERAESLS